MKDQKNQQGSGAFAAGVAGAVIATGVAVVASKVFSDKKNRDAVKDVLLTAKDKVVEYGQNLKEDAQAYKDQAADKLEEGKELVGKEAKKAVDTGKEKVKSATETAKKTAKN